MTKFDRLLADVDRGYASGLHPACGLFMLPRDGGTCVGCALTAAYVAHHGPAGVLDVDGNGIVDWAKKHYGMTFDELWGFITGFDVSRPDVALSHLKTDAERAAFDAGRTARHRHITREDRAWTSSSGC